jgi:UDP-N-acetylmuramate--alanine ligase
VAWVPSLDDAVAYLRASLRPGDLCLTLGAGDLTSVPDRLLDALGAAAP